MRHYHTYSYPHRPSNSALTPHFTVDQPHLAIAPASRSRAGCPFSPSSPSSPPVLTSRSHLHLISSHVIPTPNPKIRTPTARFIIPQSCLPPIWSVGVTVNTTYPIRLLDRVSFLAHSIEATGSNQVRALYFFFLQFFLHLSRCSPNITWQSGWMGGLLLSVVWTTKTSTLGAPNAS